MALLEWSRSIKTSSPISTSTDEWVLSSFILQIHEKWAGWWNCECNLLNFHVYKSACCLQWETVVLLREIKEHNHHQHLPQGIRLDVSRTWAHKNVQESVESYHDRLNVELYIIGRCSWVTEELRWPQAFHSTYFQLSRNLVVSNFFTVLLRTNRKKSEVTFDLYWLKGKCRWVWGWVLSIL